MIFVTVGNHFQGFDRLIKTVDEIAPRISDEMVIQKGYSTCHPKNARAFDFVPMDDSIEYIKKASVVISHAGIGTIILCKEYGIPLIIFPRRKRYGEHSNDHQMEIARAIEERKDDHIYIVYEEDRLEAKIAEFLAKGQKSVPGANLGKGNIIRTIKEFIEKNER
jgi:UDP-N-acetylglucosamine transferase subunit ALG13